MDFADIQWQFLLWSTSKLDALKFKVFKHIYFTSIEKQVLTTYTNLSRFYMPLTAWTDLLAFISNGYFSPTNTPIVFIINRGQTIDDQNKLSKFHKNQDTNADLKKKKTEKKLTDGRCEFRINGGSPCPLYGILPQKPDMVYVAFFHISYKRWTDYKCWSGHNDRWQIWLCGSLPQFI